MCATEPRAHRWATREAYLVIKTGPRDKGGRPLAGSFVSPDVTVRADGRPQAVVWNLGTREVHGVITEFAAIPAGQPICPRNKKIIGYGNPAIIPANSSVTVTCPDIWPRMASADILLVTAFHPELDPVRLPCDPIADRRVGQMNYAWAGRFLGRWEGSGTGDVKVEVRPANKGLYRVQVFCGVRLPRHPQVDRTMAPSDSLFRWQEQEGQRKEMWELTVIDNQRLTVRCRTRAASGTPVLDLQGTVCRG